MICGWLAANLEDSSEGKRLIILFPKIVLKRMHAGLDI
jgi:hypothetical protein